MGTPLNRDYRFDVQLAEGVAVETWFYEMCGGGDRFEVKNDRRALETGNVYVEMEHDPGATGTYRPSGISTSEADCWIFALGDPPVCFVGVATQRLLSLVRGGKDAAQRYGSCPTRGVLLPLAVLVGVRPP